MKISLSLFGGLEEPLARSRARLKDPRVTVSLFVETAIREFLDLDLSHQKAAVERAIIDREGGTRQGWARGFWSSLGSHVGIEDTQANELAPRWYSEHVVVMLLPTPDGMPKENDPFIIYATPAHGPSQRARTWHFDRESRPSEAACQVWDWLEKHAQDSTVNARSNSD